MKDSWLKFPAHPLLSWDLWLRNQRISDLCSTKKEILWWISGWLSPRWIKTELTTLPIRNEQGGCDVGILYLKDSVVKLKSRVQAPGVHSRVAGNDISSGTSMTLGDHRRLSGKGPLDQALQGMDRMEQPGTPLYAVFNSLLQCCINTKDITTCRELHSLIMKHGYQSDKFLGSSLIHIFSLKGTLFEANLVFCKVFEPDVFAWTVIISAHTKHGQGEQAITLYHKMQQSGVKPDGYAFVAVLQACASAAALTEGYCQDGNGQKALQLFQEMQEQGKKPDKITLVSVLKACSSIAALDQGHVIHAQVVECGFEFDVIVGSTIMDMYAKCGSLEDAQTVFNALPTRDLLTWSAMIAGYALNSEYKLALQYYRDMQQEGLKPNDIIVLCLLSACSHMGLVHEGLELFNSMREYHGIVPMIAHFNCMIDLLGRSGCLKEAEHILQRMPFKSNIVGWTSLLASCLTYGNVELGRHCFDQIITIDFRDASGYVIMSSIYVNAGMWDDARKIIMMKERAEAWKKPGKAFIQANEFTVADMDHKTICDVYAKLKSLSAQMKDGGHLPHVDVMLEGGASVI